MDRLIAASRVRVHPRKIELSVCDLSTSTIANKLLNTVYSSVKTITLPRYKVGDSVHVSKFKTTFEKNYTPNWTTEVFRIIKVQKTNPVTYLLEDYREKSVARGFYEYVEFYELHRVANLDVYL